MQHMLLIYGDEQAMGAMSEAEGEAMLRDYGRFTQDARESGVLVLPNGCGRRRRRRGAGARRGDADHRRALRRDQGAVRRLLHRRGRTASTRPRPGRPSSRGLARAASRFARSGRWPRWRPRIDDVEAVFRREWARAVAILAGALRDLDLAEDAVQDAFATALERWPRDGAPANAGAWIITTARNGAIDRLRRRRTPWPARPSRSPGWPSCPERRRRRTTWAAFPMSA